MLDELRKHFDPGLHSLIRALESSGDEWMLRLFASAQRIARLVGENPELEEKLRASQGVVLGTADCDFLPAIDVLVDANKLAGHMVVVGTTGSGKTNYIIVRVRNLLKHNVSVWIFTMKGEYLFMAETDDFMIVKPERFPINPLRWPPNCIAPMWFERFTEVLMATTDLRQVSAGDLVGILRDVHEKLSKRNEGIPIPTLVMAYLRIIELKDRLKYHKEHVILDYLTRIQDRLGSLLNSQIGRAFLYRVGVPLEEIMFRKVIFDLRGVTSAYVGFLVNLLLTFRFQYLVGKQSLRGELNHVIVLDEFEEQLLQPAGVSGLHLVSRYLRMFRQLGTGMIISSHSWRSLSLLPMVQNDVVALVCLMMGNRTDALAMAQSMGMKPEEYEEIDKLTIGRGIVKIAGVERAIPVMLDKGVDSHDVGPVDEEKLLKKTDEFVSQFQVVPVPETEYRFVLSEILKKEFDIRTAKEVVEESEERLNARVEELVKYVAAHEFCTAAELKQGVSFGGSNETFARVKSTASERDMVWEIKRGFLPSEGKRPPSRFGLLRAGYDLAEKDAHGVGKGYLQKIFRDFVKASYENQGFTVRTEDYVNRADLYVERNGKVFVAVEISVSTSIRNEISNIKRDLEDCPAVLVIVAHVTQEAGKKNVYVTNRTSELGKCEALRKAVYEEFGEDDPRTQIITFEDFRKNIQNERG